MNCFFILLVLVICDSFVDGVPQKKKATPSNSETPSESQSQSASPSPVSESPEHSPEEPLIRGLGMRRSPNGTEPSKKALLRAVKTLTSLPSSYDLRPIMGYVPVRDQGQCGSCWAFATVGCLEFLIANATRNTNTDLSEQQLVTCDRSWYGCDGGFWAFNYYISSYGPALESCFPYTSSGGTSGTPTCKTTCTPATTVRNWAYVTGSERVFPTVAQIKSAMVTYGPIGVAVYADNRWNSYYGGLFSGSTTHQTTNHAVVLVGWNDNYANTGVGAWLMRNSWSASWGENGYMWIQWDTATIGDGAAFVTISATPTSNCPTEWSGWTNCPVQCGTGQQRRTRLDANCVTQTETQLCNTNPCQSCTPLDWSAWGDCSVTCGTGRQYSTKTNADCSVNTKTQSCTMQSCSTGSNNVCSRARTVTCGNTYSGDTSTVSTNSESNCINDSRSPQLWYAITPTAGQMTVSLCSSNTRFDTMLHLATGNSCGSGLQCVKSNDDGCGSSLASTLTTTVSAKKYYIVVHGYNKYAKGAFSMKITCAKSTGTSANTTNSNCDRAVALTCGQTISSDTTGVASGVDHCFNEPSPQLWYSINLPVGPLAVSLCTASWDTRLSLEQGSCQGGMQCRAYDDDGCSAYGGSYLTNNITTAGQYYLIVRGYNGEQGPFTMTVYCGNSSALAPGPGTTDICWGASTRQVKSTPANVTLGSYSGSSTCSVTLVAAPGSRITISFPLFSASKEDYLDFWNTDGTPLVTATGKVAPAPVTSKNNTVTVVWTQRRSGNGFVFTYVESKTTTSATAAEAHVVFKTTAAAADRLLNSGAQRRIDLPRTSGAAALRLKGLAFLVICSMVGATVVMMLVYKAQASRRMPEEILYEGEPSIEEC